MDLRQTKEYGKYMRLRGWIVDKLAGSLVFLKKLPLLPFYVLKAQRGEQVDLERLDRLKKKYWVIYSVVEPDDRGMVEDLKARGYGLNKGSFLPTKTLVVDLRKPKENLWKELKKDTRQIISKQLSVDSLEIKQISSLEKFRNEWKKAKKGYLPSLNDLRAMKMAFGKKMWVLGIENKGTIIAGTIILFSEETAYYYFAFTNEEGRRLGAQYKLVWEAMMTAKKNRIKFWDFEGIEDSRFPRKSWEGFSLFKKKFGGKEISYPGSYQRWF